MKTGTLVNRFVLTLIGFSLTFLYVGAAGQTLTVNNIPDQTVNLGQSFSEINLDNYIDVPSDQFNKIQWSTTGANQLSVNIDNTRKASIVPLSNTWTGSETITFNATDTALNTGSDAATFTIHELANAAPIVSGIPDQQLAEGSAFLPVSLNDYVTDADNTKDELTWSASGNSALSVDINPSTHTATIGVPNIDWNGSETILFKATDPASAFSEDAATFTLTPVNDPPVVSDIPDQSISSGQSFSTIALDNYVTDVDNSKSELSWTITGNTNLTPSVDGSHVATITKPANWSGSEKLTFAVTDPANASASDDATFSYLASAPTDINLSNSSVDENQPAATVVGALSTVDADGGDTFVYTLVPGTGSGDNASFDISGGNLITNASFSFETQTSYSIRVRSTTDQDGQFIEKSFTIAITNVNEAPTDITLSNNTIAEHRPANTVVGNLTTTDPDAGDSFTYTLVSGTGSDDNASFNISVNQLRATATLNFETKSSYTVRVRSTDAASAFTEKQFTITVTNVNETPTDITISDNTIAENQPANTVVGTLSTTDLDIGDSFTYTLVSGTGSTDNASFNISGNNLRATASLNFEAKASYSVRIRTTDAASAFFEKAFTITVTNVNETPTNIVLSDNSVADHQPVNTVVCTISSTDPDVGDVFTYTLVSGGGSADNASFNISGNQLRTSAVFDFTTKSSYTIRLRTTDAGSAFFEKSFTITITNSNNAPTDISLSSSSIAENQPVNTVVGTLSTTDPDAGDSFTYTLVSGTGSTDNASFNISGNQLRATASLNFEIKSSYSVRVRSTDAAAAFFEKAFTITVTNANETPTDITLSDNTVADHQPVNTVVSTLSSTDPDVGDIFTYTLVSGTGSTDNASFNISGNQLRTSAIFDFITKSSYTIRIRTTDAGTSFFEKSFTITVTNSNNAPTDITLSSGSIAENLPANSVVGNLSATDPDVGDVFAFSLVSGTGSTDNGSFNILGNQLRANSPLNFELKSSYTVRVRVTDAATATFEKAFVITVVNVNEPPVIASVNYTVDGRIGVLHTGSFTGYSDPEGDAPGVHIYQWYISDNLSGTPATAITGATGLTYRPVSSDGGKFLCFEVTPVDIIGAVGIPVKSVFRKVNDAPVASNAHIYAPVSLPGQTIRGRFTYSDAEGNPRGNAIYRWYRANTGSPSTSSPGTQIGTDSTYLLKNADAGKYIWFKVKPVATIGSTPGDSIWSNIIGPIGTFSASITGTGGFCTGTTMPITLTITGGVAPFTAVLTRSGSSINRDTTITGIAESPHVITVKIAGSYVLKSVTDASTPTPDNATLTPDAVVLTAFSKPSGVLSGGAAICNDGVQKSNVTVNLSGTSPWTYTIRRGSTGNDTTFTGITSDPHTFSTRITSSPMTVRLVAISDAHCTGDTTGSGTLRVLYLPSPAAFIQGQDTICPGGTGNLKVTITGTSGPWSITYLRDGANPTVVSPPIAISPYTLAVQGTGTFTLSKVQQSSGCTGRVSGTGKIIPFTVPTATLSGTATFCQYTTGNLSVNLTGNSPWKFSYKLDSETPVEVLNVSSSPNAVPITKGGTYTLVEVFDKNCKGTTSGSATMTITPAPVVSISGLAPAYNKDSSEMVHLIGTPSGGAFSGPGVIPYFNDWYFLTSLPPAGTHHIVYSYRESPASCYGYDTAIVRVLKANAIIEFPENRVKYCQNEVPFTVTGVNLANNIGSFTISGGAGLVNHGDNTASVDPSKLSVKEYTITYTYFDGTMLYVNSNFEVGKSPVSDFQWESECFEANQAIKFQSVSSSTFGNITAYHWKVFTSTGFDTASSAEISHAFPEPGNNRIELQVETSYGCSASVNKVFDLRPTIIPKANGFRTETFETAPLSWRSATSSTPKTNSWTLGNPRDLSGIHGAHSDTSCWYTNIPASGASMEQSWVSSPCYDFTGMNRPMVKMEIWRDFNGRRDGSVLQATTDSSKTWFNIGQLEDGLNWFNEYSILGTVGNQHIGWSNKQDGHWIESRHSLDMLKGKTRVQFRIAYGSDGTVQNTDGFAFDDFWIGERNRKVLIEHFTNSSDAASSDADAKLNSLVDGDSLNTIDLQYHTSFPGDDPLNGQEPYAPSARLLYYGISDVPYAILNGGYKPGYQFDYSSTNDLDANLVHLESLNDAQFGIEFSESSWDGNNVKFTIQFQPKQDMQTHEFTVHAGVLERRVAGPGPDGDTVYENVVRALLPDPAGITISEPWPASSRKEHDYVWEIPEGYNREQIMAFAFIQDEETHEIYQTNLVKIGYATGTHDILPGLSHDKFFVFPNPANDQAFIRFEKPVKGKVRIEMFNNLGSLVYAGILPQTDSDSEIMTDKYPDGLYIIRITTGNELLGVTKLNITH
jgi:mRNA-degrading endonuclease HigB of HigAB toxin-antitoxin module